MTDRMHMIALDGIPLVEPGDDLAALFDAALDRAGERYADGDILVIAQKIVSKAEGRIVDLVDVSPSARAVELAAEVDKDPRVVELILSEARDVVRTKPGVLVVEHRLGIVIPNAGIDASNVEEAERGERVVLLPEDPDGSCAALREAIRARIGKDVGVIINDSVGRAWRVGTTGLALGVAGLASVVDLRGEKDLFGRELRVSEQAIADELASAASLLQGQGAEGRPVVLVRGYTCDAPLQTADALLRSKEDDMFR